jgi:hypothetical protein
MTATLALLVILYIGVICLLLVLRGQMPFRDVTPHNPDRNASGLIFISVMLLELAAGYYIHDIKNMIMGDCLSRVANAFYVLYIQPAHLASIGFVWTPLPSFLELPFLLLAPIFKPLATSGLAGVIVTSLFSAGTAVLLYKNYKRFKIPAWITILILILYVCNPVIFLYGFNGMSEAIFIFFVVWVTGELLCWIDDEKPRHLMRIGIALALAFLTRYEAVPFAMAVFLAVGFFMIKKRRSRNYGESLWGYFEGTSIVLFLPLATCGLLWVLSNWIIMGDPLYFLTSAYSNITQSGQNLPVNIQAIVGNSSEVLLYIAKMSLPFVPLLAVILLFRLFNKRLFQWETLMFLILAVSIPAMQYAMLMTGNSFGWLRFFLYPLPVAVAWLPHEFSKLRIRQNAFRIIATCFCCIALIASGVLTWMAVNNPDTGREEYSVYVSGDLNLGLEAQKGAAEYINQNCTDGILLLDSFETYYVILNLDSTGNVITTCSYTFEAAVQNPMEYSVKYILAVSPRNLGESDAINRYYPDLYGQRRGLVYLGCGVRWLQALPDWL